MYNLDFDWTQIGYNLWHLGIACLLALPVAFDRYEIAMLLSAMTFITLRLGRQFKTAVEKSD